MIYRAPAFFGLASRSRTPSTTFESSREFQLLALSSLQCTHHLLVSKNPESHRLHELLTWETSSISRTPDRP